MALGAGWRSEIDAGMVGRLRRRLPISRILFGPFFVRRRDVRHVANVPYGDAGRRNLLDVYHHPGTPSGGPVLVYLHGGGFRSGRKNREARPLLYRLASQGWVCISANYRLAPAARFPEYLVDVKKAIAWARDHGHVYGADTALVFVAGSSSGGHLALLAGLTPSDPSFQPGFERADTSVAAVISLYGYYGPIDTSASRPSTPFAYVRPDAPPFFVAHGDHDTLVPVEGARRFQATLRQVSSQPVVYPELPGAQHTFDLFHSIRFETLIDGIEAFAAWVRSTDGRRIAETGHGQPIGG
jgi:acetyl esterase/lipase